MATAQAEITVALGYLAKTTSGYKSMVTKYGSDWTKWPATSNWYLALAALRRANADLSQVLTAAFSFKES